jgi:starch-binding outer membrane protein, SusD/RagB family
MNEARHRHQASAVRRRRCDRMMYAAIVGPALVVGLSSCDGLLDVDLPGRLPAEELGDPQMVDLLVASVQADFECAYGAFAAWTGLFTDEWMSASSFGPGPEAIDRQEALVRDMGTTVCSSSPVANQPGYYQHVQVARAQGETAFELISGHEGVPEKDLKLATVAAYTGYALTLLGEGFCEMALDGGPLMQRAEVLAEAEQRFTTAIDLAEGIDNEEILNWASVGRARVRVALGEPEGALADAARVPQGFVKNATYAATPGRRMNRLYGVNIAGRFYTLDVSFRNLTVGGVSDTRITGIDEGVPGHDGQSELWTTNKFRDAGDPIPLAQWEEAQLIIAEIRGGTEAVAAINRIRDHWGLPRFSSVNPVEIRAEILEERRRVLFGQAQRIADIVRFPELELPSGLRPHKGDPYSDNFQCLPLPWAELDGNANF